MFNVGNLSLKLEPVETLYFIVRAGDHGHRRETTTLVFQNLLIFFSSVSSYNKFPMSSLSASESVVVKELFVSSKTPVQCHLSRAVKHLELDNSVLILNGLGKAIITTIDVALKLQQQFHNTIKLDIQTSTAEIKDILEPLNEEDDYEARTRSLSSIHIKITK